MRCTIGGHQDPLLSPSPIPPEACAALSSPAADLALTPPRTPRAAFDRALAAVRN